MSKISRSTMEDSELHNLEHLLMKYLESNVSPGYKQRAKHLLQSIRMMKSQRVRRTREES